MYHSMFLTNQLSRRNIRERKYKYSQLVVGADIAPLEFGQVIILLDGYIPVRYKQGLKCTCNSIESRLMFHIIPF
jgi:hypothetical protein